VISLPTPSIELLKSPALTVAGAAISWSEVLGDVAGVACVWLLARQNIWNWPLGLVNNVLWAILFVDAKLYGDAVLQGVFFALSVYGWWNWLHGRGAAGEQLPVRRTLRNEWIVLGAATVVATCAATWVLATRTDSPVPLWDASVLTLSLWATYGQTQKLVESWWLWIAVDVISVPLYLSRGLYPTAAVYVLFGILCVKGLRQWKRSLA
jgi:nicotinamide mononucleotide transporter